MQLDLLAEYIKLTNKRIKFPWRKRKIADLRKLLSTDYCSGLNGLTDDSTKHKPKKSVDNIKYPYTADELRADHEKRVYDGRAQRRPW